jgi:signal transduction histidine kinase
MLLDRERQVLRVAVGRGLGDHHHPRPNVEVKVGEGIAGRVVQMGEAVLVEDIEKDPRFARVSDPKYGGGSFICMPLRVGDRIVGVVNLARKESAEGVPSQAFTPTDLQFLNALMTYTAYAVDNARLFEEAREAAQRLEEVVEDQKLRLTLAQQQMLQAAKLSALGELVAGVAHELNNPLTVLTGTADMIEAAATPAVQEHVRLMREAINSAQYVVRGLLTFGRQMPLEKKPVDLADLTERVLALTFGELHVADVKVRKDIAPSLPPVWADANQLQQVLVNLINNAKQAMADVPGERRLAISVRPAGGGHVRIEVADTGPGIPAETLSRVFDPFVTTKSDGTGLGLSISYGIVREHGGTLSVESTVGQGATFVIELPIEAAPAPAS